MGVSIYIYIYIHIYIYIYIYICACWCGRPPVGGREDRPAHCALLLGGTARLGRRRRGAGIAKGGIVLLRFSHTLTKTCTRHQGARPGSAHAALSPIGTHVA